MLFPVPRAPRRAAGPTTPDPTPDPTPPSAAATFVGTAPEASVRPLGDVERARVLQRAVQHASAHGAQVVSMSAHHALIDHRLTPAHRRHVLDSDCTSCRWASALGLTPARTSVLGAGRRRWLLLTVDELGVITAHPVPAPQR